MIIVRHSDERGSIDIGWLKSRHTFSFGQYYDPAHLGVSVLRVINDDEVQPGQGFATHSHRDMEIISYVKEGVIEHQDSLGNVERLPAGEFQLMAAGTGVTHSEYNPSDSNPLRFLQIWIEPSRRSVVPGYQQKRFESNEGLRPVISPDGSDGTLRIHQDAYVYQLLLTAGSASHHAPENGRTVYVHIVRGELTANGTRLSAGDGATLAEEENIEFATESDAEALLFDLP